MVVVLLDENDNLIDGSSFTGAWGGVGKTWYNVTTTGGTTFRKAVIFNNSFDPFTFVDNISWNTVPAPGAIAFFAMGLLGCNRRRR